MSLPTTWVDALFTKLTLAYGRDFLGRWEGLEVSDVKTDWGHELAGFEQHPEAIAYALANLPIKPPTVLEFRALCRRAPVPEAPRLEAPQADPARVAAELAKLAPMRARAVDVDRKDWARSLLARHDAGEKLRPISLRFAREALRISQKQGAHA